MEDLEGFKEAEVNMPRVQFLKELNERVDKAVAWSVEDPDDTGRSPFEQLCGVVKDLITALERNQL